MKIKIIDLLNKIANGEDVPERISVYNKWCLGKTTYMLGNKYWSWQDWYMEEEDNTKNLFDNNSIGLNDEIEIIEDNKKIERINDKEADDMKVNRIELSNYGLQHKIVDIYDKINEIIDKLNEGDK